MTINVNVLDYANRLLYLQLGYGLGWQAGEPPTPIDYAPLEAAGPCNVRVKSFFTWRGDVRGIVGKIEKAGHKFHGMWIVCADMIAGTHDFRHNISLRFDLQIGSTEPDCREWPEIKKCDSTYYGFGILADEQQNIELFLQQSAPSDLPAQ